MLGLKGLIKQDEERKRKKAEREKRKKEKEEAKAAEKRAKRKKKLRHQQNQRYYAKIKKKMEKERKEKGYEWGYCMVLLVKNHKRVKRLGASWWKTDAFKIYNDALEKNHEEVKFPVKFRTSCESSVRKNNRIDTKWEVIIVQRLNDEEDSNITQFRNDEGKFVNVEIVDKQLYKVIARGEWFVEEHFYVYGYHPKKDRKTYQFILNNLILDKLETINDILQITTVRNKLMISHSEDFDFVICKNAEEAERLYSALQTDEALKKNERVIFFGSVTNLNSVNKVYDRIEEKTGWDRTLIKKTSVL